MTEFFEAIASWHNLLLVLLAFGFAPGFILRLLVRIYPRSDPRRTELVAQLYVLGRLERPLFVAEQLETVLFEGLPHRIQTMRRRVKTEEAQLSAGSPASEIRKLVGLMASNAVAAVPLAWFTFGTDQTETPATPLAVAIVGIAGISFTLSFLAVRRMYRLTKTIARLLRK